MPSSTQFPFLLPSVSPTLLLIVYDLQFLLPPVSPTFLLLVSLVFYQRLLLLLLLHASSAILQQLLPVPDPVTSTSTSTRTSDFNFYQYIVTLRQLSQLSQKTEKRSHPTVIYQYRWSYSSSPSSMTRHPPLLLHQRAPQLRLPPLLCTVPLHTSPAVHPTPRPVP